MWIFHVLCGSDVSCFQLKKQKKTNVICYHPKPVTHCTITDQTLQWWVMYISIVSYLSTFANLQIKTVGHKLPYVLISCKCLAVIHSFVWYVSGWQWNYSFKKNLTATIKITDTKNLALEHKKPTLSVMRTKNCQTLLNLRDILLSLFSLSPISLNNSMFLIV